jgi:hypothetical protein
VNVPAGRAEALETARLALGLSVAQLWLDCLGLGGNLGPRALAGFLSGRAAVSDYEHDVVTQALNERFAERARDHPLAYADELTTPGRPPLDAGGY